MPGQMIKRLLDRQGLVFALVFCWKVALLAFTGQPIPANDSFFYDGPVVHLLNHGGYFNPSIALARPISGTEFFSAYPPGYQLSLLPWMAIFGTTALSACWFHLVLFGGYLLVVLAIFRHFAVPARYSNLAGLFLLAITFHDRPDSLAFFFGTLAFYASARALDLSKDSSSDLGSNVWAWLAAGFVILTLCTSLQIGGVYFAFVFLSTTMAWKILHRPLPKLPLAAMFLTPPALIALVRFGFPGLWAGFIENVHDNPSLTGLRTPVVVEFLKIGRSAPGVIAIAALVVFNFKRWGTVARSGACGPREITLASGLAVALMVMGGCLSIVTPNWVSAAMYLQPILVGLFLSSLAPMLAAYVRPAVITGLVVLPACLAAVRAVGMSTWGAACAADVSYGAAIARVRSELRAPPSGQKAMVSSAYLYEADRSTNGIWIHEAYPMPPKTDETYADALRRLRVSKLVLTQFDYYRRYQPVVAELRAQGGVKVEIVDMARVRPPDSYLPLRQVLQHISWAPVIVTLRWN